MTSGFAGTTVGAGAPVVAEGAGGDGRPELAGAVMAALAGVRDPELDEPVTELGFVAGVVVSGDRVEVALRLPTYFCAPNFAWLMVSDARAAVRMVSGVGEVEVRLVDHFAAEEINEGIGEGQKALAARQDRLCRMLLAGGGSPADLTERRLADLPAGADTDRYLQRRAELGLDVSPGAPFLVDRSGAPVSPERAAPYVRRLRTIAVSIEGNAGFCRGLLATRYPTGQGPAQRTGRD